MSGASGVAAATLLPWPILSRRVFIASQLFARRKRRKRRKHRRAVMAEGFSVGDPPSHSGGAIPSSTKLITTMRPSNELLGPSLACITYLNGVGEFGEY